MRAATREIALRIKAYADRMEEDKREMELLGLVHKGEASGERTPEGKLDGVSCARLTEGEKILSKIEGIERLLLELRGKIDTLSQIPPARVPFWRGRRVQTHRT